MTTSPFLLNGNVDNRDEEIATLRQQLRQIDEALRLERLKVGQIEHAGRELRKMTLPFYNLLRAIHGELDAMGVGEQAIGNVADNAKWEFWKKRFGGRIAETIDLLLIQKRMNSSQLKSALKCDPRTLAKSVIYPMNSAGIIVKNGNEYSLKEL